MALGFISAAPIIHLISIYGLKHVIDHGALYHALLMGALYVTGACLYAARIPERFMPGKCDIWFQSHQVILHFLLFGEIDQIIAIVVADPGIKTGHWVREHLGTVGLSGHHPSLEHPACSFQPEATATTREEF